MNQNELLSTLGDHPWSGLITIYDTLSSTNTLAMTLASEGAPEGTVVIADHQSGGRGRMGRSFSSPKGLGLYYSLILRPERGPEELLHVTPMVAVAAMDAVTEVTGIRPGIKWINDLILMERKLAGILTESVIDPATGKVSHMVVGIGINCNQIMEDFPQELNAISLKMATGREVSREHLAAILTKKLYEMNQSLFTGKAQWLRRYGEHCLTLGKKVKVIRGGQKEAAFALSLDADGGLLVRYMDGREEAVSYGEVSVRGERGYI